MNNPNFYTAFYAAVNAVRDGDVDEAEVNYSVGDGDRLCELTVTLRRYSAETVEGSVETN